MLVPINDQYSCTSIVLHIFVLIFRNVEFCRAPYQVVMKIPDGVSITNAAGIRKSMHL